MIKSTLTAGEPNAKARRKARGRISNLQTRMQTAAARSAARPTTAGCVISRPSTRARRKARGRISNLQTRMQTAAARSAARPTTAGSAIRLFTFSLFNFYKCHLYLQSKNNISFQFTGLFVYYIQVLMLFDISIFLF